MADVPTAYVSIGSNVERERNVAAAVDLLAERFGPLRLSRVYESEAVGFAGDPFYNLAAGFETDAEAAEVARALRQIEQRRGRRRGGPRFGPRTLDLDLLLYGDLVTEGPPPLPRPEILSCAFVLAPLAEIAGALVHPVAGLTLAELWSRFDRSSQQVRMTGQGPGQGEPDPLRRQAGR